MQVRVIRAGIYNGPGHRALSLAEPDDIIDVADAEYADSLEARGFVTRNLGPGPIETQISRGPTEMPSRPRRKLRRKDATA